jgi:hypothetical protein
MGFIQQYPVKGEIEKIEVLTFTYDCVGAGHARDDRLRNKNKFTGNRWFNPGNVRPDHGNNGCLY